MKDIRDKLISLLRKGYCTPQVSQLARKLKEPSSTIHYNIKRLETEGVLRSYRAVVDHKASGLGFCSFVLLSLSSDEYGDPERIARELSAFDEIESIDIIAGNWELIAKVRAHDQDAYYSFVKEIISRKGVEKISSLISLKAVKTEFNPL